MKCSVCESGDSMPHTCNECGKTFCNVHRLPENHGCLALQSRGEENSKWFSEKFKRSNVRADRERNSKQKGSRTRGSENNTGSDSKRRDWGSPSPDVNPDGSIVSDSTVNQSNKNTSTSENPGTTLIAVLLMPIFLVMDLVSALLAYPLSSPARFVKIVVLIGIVILAAGQLGYGPVQDTTTLSEGVSGGAESAGEFFSTEPIEEERVEELVVEKINDRRSDRGLQELRTSDRLTGAAQDHSEHMREEDQLSHNLEGSTTGGRLRAAGCTYGAENVAQSWVRERVRTQDGTTYISSAEELAEQLVEGWMNSSGHRKNILDGKLSITGVGISIDGDGKVYATQKFCTG